MSSIVRTIVLRLVACTLGSYLLFRLVMGDSGGSWAVVAGYMVLCAPLFAVALAKPILELISEIRHGVRVLVWRKLEGQYFAFHGHSVRVMEDMHHIRWVLVEDIQRITGDDTGTHALRHSYGHQFAWSGQPPQAWLSDEALLVHLTKQGRRNATALRLHHWVEREIAFPARRIREQRGTRHALEPVGTASRGPAQGSRDEAPAPTASALPSAASPGAPASGDA
jgi:hypothetical protein